MRFMLLFGCVGAAAALVGCTSPSLNPLVSEDVRIRDPGIVGVWAKAEEDSDDRSRYTITSEDGGYLLKWDEGGKPERRWSFLLAKLGDHVFADLTMTRPDAEKLEDRVGTVAVPTHSFMRVRREGDRMSVWVVNDDWLDEGLRAGTLKLAHARHGEGELLLTATTPELQAFFRQHAGTAAAWRDEFRLDRQKPTR